MPPQGSGSCPAGSGQWRRTRIPADIKLGKGPQRTRQWDGRAQREGPGKHSGGLTLWSTIMGLLCEERLRGSSRVVHKNKSRSSVQARKTIQEDTMPETRAKNSEIRGGFGPHANEEILCLLWNAEEMGLNWSIRDWR